MSINMEEKNTEKEPLIRVENLKNIIPSGAALLPIRQAMCIQWTAFPFRLQREKPSVWWANPDAANRRWADSWSAWKRRRAAGCFIRERIWRSFPEKRKKSVRTQLQMVFQDHILPLNPRKHIYEILSQPMPLSWGFPIKETVHRDVDRLLDMVGLPNARPRALPA